MKNIFNKISGIIKHKHPFKLTGLIRIIFFIIIFILSVFLIKMMVHQIKKSHTHHIHNTHNTHKQTSSTLVAPAIIDAMNDVTHISSLQSGLLKQIYVKVGETVLRGQKLFELDHALVQNNVRIQKILITQAQNQYQIQSKKVIHDQNLLNRLKSLDPRAISRIELQEKIYELNQDMNLLKQSEQQLALAKANLKQAQITLQEYIIKSPKNGVVLQINTHKNELISSSQPIILLGDAQKVMVRVSLDERDLKRFDPHHKAYLTYENTYENTYQDNKHLKIPLKFLRLDQYMITQERFNASHVQEALYYFNRRDYPTIVAGQQLDAHIKG